MKKLLVFFLTGFSTVVYCQPTLPFGNCPSEQVIVYKDGTNCTNASYNFYTIDVLGNIIAQIGSSLPLSVEVNAIGLNNVDKFLYGVKYDRIGNSSPCTFQNSKLFRMDAAGVMDELGLITPPTGGTISNAFGAMSIDGKYLFLATVGSDIYLGVIPSSQTLVVGAAINPTYFLVTNNCLGKSIADWAISPLDGNLYSYATYVENIAGTNFMRGTVIKIDLTNFTYSCQGTPNTTDLLDPLRDNFGGIFFDSDNSLYGLNINTRKFYKINITTGLLLELSTIPGSGNMRGDLASCVSSTTVLPVKVSNFSAKANPCNNIISWIFGNTNDYKSHTILKSTDGTNFKEIFNDNNYLNNVYNDNAIANEANVFYKLKIKELNGNTFYSDVIIITNPCKNNTAIRLLTNPVTNNLTAIYNGITKNIQIVTITDMQGRNVKIKNIISSINKIELDTHDLATGIYILGLVENNGNKTFLKFVKK